ncbi:MAG: hypothetical protein IV100_08435 [Myxococcales bacterium]|nr:hypothetical protein [Myxococcales bacterium]
MSFPQCSTTAFGRCDVFRKTFIVHAPSGDHYNTSKADGLRTRFFTPPPLDELVALGELEGVDSDEVRLHIAHYGKSNKRVSQLTFSRREWFFFHTQKNKTLTIAPSLDPLPAYNSR